MTTLTRTDKLWNRAFSAAERLFVRFSDPDAHKTARMLLEIRRMALRLSKSRNRHVIRMADARIYTLLQSATNSRLRISRNNILFRTEDLFHETKRVLDSISHLNSEPEPCPGMLQRKMEQMGELFLLLELQIISFSPRRALRLGTRFAAQAQSIRGELKKCRLQVLAGESQYGHAPALTVIDEIEKWIAVTETLACSAIKTRIAHPRMARKT